MGYGNELILDLVKCDVVTFTRESIDAYLEALCALIGAKREALHWWDYEGLPDEYAAAPPHMRGRSVVQFISTSSVVIHTLDDASTALINIFSCGEFDAVAVRRLTENHFGGHAGGATQVERGAEWSA